MDDRSVARTADGGSTTGGRAGDTTGDGVAGVVVPGAGAVVGSVADGTVVGLVAAERSASAWRNR
jgi:hypothetical protein